MDVFSISDNAIIECGMHENALRLFDEYLKIKETNKQRSEGMPEDKNIIDINTLKNKAQRFYESYLADSKKKVIVLFFKSPIYGQYGISTYLQSLLSLIPSAYYDIIVCYLDAPNMDFFLSSNFAIYHFPRLINTQISSCQEKLSKVIFYTIASKIGSNKTVICHFNLYGYSTLIKLFKSKMIAKIIFTVHYTSWGLNLRGQTSLIQNLKEQHMSQLRERDRKILELTCEEQENLSNCDYVIAPSNFTVNHLKSVYNIPDSKIIYVPHSIKQFRGLSAKSRNVIRKEYGLGEDHNIFLYVGRIDENKGLESLISAFVRLYRQSAMCRLIIAGDGDFQSILKIIPSFARNSIVFVGFAEDNVLYELMKMADIGVVPSYYEEFGYTAAEMLMTGMPVVCSNTSGLQQFKQWWHNIYYFRHDAYNNDLFKCLTQVLNKGQKRDSEQVLRITKEDINLNFKKCMHNLYGIPK